MNDNLAQNAVRFLGLTKCELTPTAVLVGALASGLERICVIGRDKDGQLYVASSNSDVSKTLYDIEAFKHRFI